VVSGGSKPSAPSGSASRFEVEHQFGFWVPVGQEHERTILMQDERFLLSSSVSRSSSLLNRWLRIAPVHRPGLRYPHSLAELIQTDAYDDPMARSEAERAFDRSFQTSSHDCSYLCFTRRRRSSASIIWLRNPAGQWPACLNSDQQRLGDWECPGCLGGLELFEAARFKPGQRVKGG